MNIKNAAKLTFNRTLRRFGWKLKRTADYLEEIKTEKILDLVDDPMEALLKSQAGEKFAFNCPVELCRFESGFGYAQNEWHPFVATLKQYKNNKDLEYKDTILKKYYERWQPVNAAEALTGFHKAPKQLNQMPSFCMFLLPWTTRSPEWVKTSMTKYINADYSEHGRPDLRWDQHGLLHFGPVADALGLLEFSRLTNIYDRLEAGGYDRNHGEIGVFMVRREDDYRFLIGGGGTHRAAAMAAIGYQTFPAQYKVDNFVANARDVPYWPLVCSGLWTQNEALDYLDHLFEFDSFSWANHLGLLE